MEIAEARASLGLDPEVRPGEPPLRFNDQDFLEYHMRLGIVTINEARERLGLPAIEGGEARVRTEPKTEGGAGQETGGPGENDPEADAEPDGGEDGERDTE